MLAIGGKGIYLSEKTVHFSSSAFVECSFQILHALHSLERILDEFRRRSAIFEIVFWEGLRQVFVICNVCVIPFIFSKSTWRATLSDSGSHSPSGTSDGSQYTRPPIRNTLRRELAGIRTGEKGEEFRFNTGYAFNRSCSQCLL
jgi:hypothetical protein